LYESKPVLEVLAKYSKNPWSLGDGESEIGCSLLSSFDDARQVEKNSRIQITKYHQSKKPQRGGKYEILLMVHEFKLFDAECLPLNALFFRLVIIYYRYKFYEIVKMLKNPKLPMKHEKTQTLNQQETFVLPKLLEEQDCKHHLCPQAKHLIGRMGDYFRTLFSRDPFSSQSPAGLTIIVS
jgi:hypothetical protein